MTNADPIVNLLKAPPFFADTDGTLLRLQNE
jgi:hypothetical protein